MLGRSALLAKQDAREIKLPSISFCVRFIDVRCTSAGCDAHRCRRRFEDHVYIRATAPWAHEAASESAEREAKALCPDQRLHVEFGHLFALLIPNRRLDRASHTSGADAPTEPVGLAKGLDFH